MINLKKTKADSAQLASPSYSEPDYPYGLLIRLDEDTIKKLGIKELPPVGTVMNIKAEVEVSSTEEYESIEGGARRSLGLQITDMTLGKPKTEVDADKIYNKK